MNPQIYLDNNATTPIDKKVLDAMLPYLQEEYGNPSSTYAFGKDNRKAIKNARNSIASLLNCDSSQIIFTSSGSESNVTAIMSAIKIDSTKKHILTTKVEHTSVIETMHYLETQGYEITYLNVDELGRLNLEELRNKIKKDTCLISVMMANNEIGNIYPIKEITKIAHEKGILVHCDAIQSVGKIPIDVRDLDIDFLSFSGHKINAPKGIGALYIKDSKIYTPLIFGHQERDRRGGTENVPYIVGLGKAIEIILKDSSEKGIEKLRDYMESEIKQKIQNIHIYGDLTNRIPNTSSIAFQGVKADELMLVLEGYGVLVSTGSACNSEIALPSHVLVACGADLNSYSPIRISLGKYNTKEEIDKFVQALVKAVSMLRKKGK